MRKVEHRTSLWINVALGISAKFAYNLTIR